MLFFNHKCVRYVHKKKLGLDSNAPLLKSQMWKFIQTFYKSRLYDSNQIEALRLGWGVWCTWEVHTLRWLLGWCVFVSVCFCVCVYLRVIFVWSECISGTHLPDILMILVVLPISWQLCFEEEFCEAFLWDTFLKWGISRNDFVGAILTWKILLCRGQWRPAVVNCKHRVAISKHPYV